jgi:outer membrane protein OmpA-like peptidoglycan-associated protein
MVMKKLTLSAALVTATCCVVLSCAGQQQTSQTTTSRQQPPAPTSATTVAPTATVAKTPVVDELDLAIRDASDYLNDNIPENSKIVILNIESNYANLSEYIIDELIANAVNDKKFSVVDRRQLDAIQSEQKFQMSGAVDDKDALAIGKFFGAQTIISGTMRDIGGRYRMTIRALSVQTAQVQGQYNRNMAIGETLAGLANSSGGRPVSGTVPMTNTNTTQTPAVAATTSTNVASTGNISGAFETIYFDYDKNGLRQESINTLGKITNVMRENPKIRVMVEGHANERGTSAYNTGLGEVRAKVVRDYLVSNGINGNRIEIISYGKERPANPNCDGNEECNSKSRRVEWRILAK